MRWFARALAVPVFGFAVTAQAAEQDSYPAWYVGIGINGNFADDSKVSGSATGRVRYDSSLTLPDLVVGYRPQALYNQTGDVRFELGLLNRAFGIGRVTSGATSNKPGGSLGVSALMVSAYYDFHTGTAFTPFLGAGIGAAGARFSKNPGFSVTDKSSNDAAFAYQFVAGVSYTPEAWPNTDWSLAYTHFGAGSTRYDTSAGHIRLDDLHSNGVQAGFKYHF